MDSTVRGASIASDWTMTRLLSVEHHVSGRQIGSKCALQGLNFLSFRSFPVWVVARITYVLRTSFQCVLKRRLQIETVPDGKWTPRQCNVAGLYSMKSSAQIYFMCVYYSVTYIY